MIAATVLAVSSVAATGYSAYQQRQAGKEQAEARRIEQRKGALQQRKNTLEALKESQMTRSRQAQSAGAAGLADTSAAAQAVGGVQTQTAENIAFSNNIFNLQTASSQRLERAASYNSRAQLGQAVSQIAQQGASAVMGAA